MCGFKARDADRLQVGCQAQEAEKVFRAAITDKRPRDGRLLFGLWQSLLAQARSDEAKFVEQQFRAAWDNATTNLRVEDL
ncbi:hypothetical protein [Geoalkalibacter halelectricus]|uniref:hypothetical protein n=1 Tax=Geoalkalibacter halelectricus TaxID=2847045 RepID=UPI00266F4DEB|nr:hypothetical protein [Geoalkalibacter halelectricus]